MVKKLFILSFLLLSVLGCNNSALKPDVYSKETIEQKYPYWQVGIDRFEINSKKYTAITIDEKKYMLVCMALIRMAVNTDEFVERVKKLDAELGSSVEDSYNGQVLKVGDKYDAQKIIDCVRSLKYNFGYRKVEGVAVGTGVGPVGKSRYLRYGVQPDNEIPIGEWIGFSTGNWGSIEDVLFGDYFTYMQSQTYANTAGLMFHEHMHNIGFHHVGKYAVPYTLQGVVTGILNEILWKDAKLREKYSKQVDELIAYYLTEYKYLLTEDTIYDPSQK